MERALLGADEEILLLTLGRITSDGRLRRCRHRLRSANRVDLDPTKTVIPAEGETRNIKRKCSHSQIELE